MNGKSETVLVGRSRKRFILRFVQGVIAVAIGVWRLADIGWIPTAERDSLLLVSLAAVLAVGGLWLIVWSLQSMRSARAPVIRFDRDGITIERPAVGTLPWNAVTGVRAQRIRSRQYLHITLGDPALIAALHTRLQGAIVERELWFDVSDLELDAQDLAELITQGQRGEGFNGPHPANAPFG